ncbi:penicillin-binding protein activator [Qipengyuania marisflavi]|uniref:Penicillin-binding protein activator n=1 Tax=Qipengyuania marisflavi TaxID=2486356 RepID=A0A5S3PAW0_9SPHN|nr:penicillin-binding protein activator [Qipengyuania marisflavi]TMM49885.1 penicillin-binding protein activator [Qipengyuania marisflavi]
MKRLMITRRTMATAALAGLLAGCSIIPKGPTSTRPVDPAPTVATEPSATELPTDETRHRVALLVPMSGQNGAVGQAIANATTMALMDTNATNLRITTYDTARGPQEAARKALAEGNKLILGPLLGSNVVSVQAEAGPANVPIISFSNDTSIAGPNVFVMGHIPEQSIMRTVQYARGRGARDFAILSPDGEYGQRAEDAMRAAVAAYGGRVSWVERYDRGNTSIVSAARRLKSQGGYDSVLIAENARLATMAAGPLREGSGSSTRLMGTELWSGESAITRAPALNGAMFSAVSDGRFKRFIDSYEARFGSQPYRIATLGYDAVLLSLRIARDWKPGRTFPIDALRSDDGFLGLDGAFRFQNNGVVQRAMEVREVRSGEVVVIDGAPTRF